MAALRKRKQKFDSPFRLREIQPLTKNQEIVFEQFPNNHMVLHGSAGTGKSFLGLYLGLKELESGKFDKIILLRSAVPTRDLGFLPGTIEEKAAIYELPYKAIVNDLYSNNNAYNDLKTKGKIEFLSTSYNRGLTWDDSLIIVDESQNLGFGELDTIMTRTGEGSKIIFLGDELQNDLTVKKSDVSGFPVFLRVLALLRAFKIVEFSIDDCVRSGVVRDYLRAKDNLFKKGL